MSDGLPTDIPEPHSAPRLPVSRTSRKPENGRCQCCGRFAGHAGLVWDHCHDCGQGRGWACDDCNVALSKHLILHWVEAHAYLEGHRCPGPPPALFDSPDATPSVRLQRSVHTRTLHLSNGGGDGRTVNVSRHKGYVTIEQLAVLLGINTASARDLVNGRRGRQHDAKRTEDGTYLVPTESVITIIEERTRKGLL